jgi:hypothetical protein
MQPAAFGVQMHSGWGVLVALSLDPLELLARRRIVTADPEIPGAIQPYHFAAQLEHAQQEKHLSHCAASSCTLAGSAICEVVSELNQRHYRVVGAAVLFAAGRSLPALEKILSAHPLIHTAEGEFFRQAAAKAFESLQIPVTSIRERDLDERAKAAFGNRASRVQATLSNLGTSVGPPWTRDHKTAAVAAALILATSEQEVRRCP